MADYLLYAQALFYTVASAAIVVCGTALAISAYHLVRIARKLRTIAENAESVSSDISERIHSLLNLLEELPIISSFLKRSASKGKKTERGHKGR